MSLAVGTSSCSNSSRFGDISTFGWVTPVTLPPGRLKAGDEAELDRVGGCCQRRSELWWLPPLPQALQQWWSRQSRSPCAGPDRRPVPAADHIVLPPSGIRSPRCGHRRNRFRSDPDERRHQWARSHQATNELRNPITGIARCCARAASGQAPPHRRASVMNSRRFMSDPKVRKRHLSGSNDYFDRG